MRGLRGVRKVERESCLPVLGGVGRRVLVERAERTRRAGVGVGESIVGEL